jgi:phage terminase large subunit GpA-like protein
MLSTDQEYLVSDIEFLIEQNNNKPTKRPEPLISTYIENKRILPLGTPFPGPWRNEKTPYLVEFMDNMSPFSPIQHQSWMKGAQIGCTAAAENVIAYYADENPAEQLYMSATEALLKKWVGKRLDPLFESCNIKIQAPVLKIGKNKRSGDTQYNKEYPGGSVDLASAQSAASMRSDSKRVLIRDEIDAAPKMLHTGEGAWLEVSYARTNAWGHRRKITDLSTPQIDGESAIQIQYEQGDQRKFFVPCPICQKMQVLEWGTSQRQHGLHFETKAGRFAECYYVCEYCHDIFRNSQKMFFLPRGKWIPTAQSFDPTYRSYHISTLYSPVGMMPWDEVVKAYLKAKEEQDGLRSWVNLYLGKPYKERGTRPKVDDVIELTSGYKQDTIPDGPTFLTMGIDVQQGSNDPEKKNPPRIELEVCGHGSRFRTWSITYRVIEGAIDDPDAGAWAELAEMQKAGKLTFIRSDGMEFAPRLILVDSGFNTDVVYRFCSMWRNTFPSKGRREIQRFVARKKGKEDPGDEFKDDNAVRYRSTKMSEDVTLYNISTNYYKNHVYNNLKIRREIEGPERAGFCAFPKDYGRRYFEMLTAEERRRDGSYHAGTRRNEALDIRVLNLAACDIYLDARVQELKAWARKKGMTPVQISQIGHKTVLDHLEKQARRRVGE